MNEELRHKVGQSIRLIKAAGKAAAKHGQPLEICYSGGKDSDVILELARMSGVEYRAIYKNTTIDPPGTIAHVKEKGVEVMRPKKSFAELVAQKGFPSRTVRFCCQELKEYKVLDYAIVGIRACESKKRSQLYKEPEQCRLYKKGTQARHYFPILSWSKRDVEEFIADRHITCHHLYYDEKGKFYPERRLGCMGCPLASRRKRIAEFKAYPNMVKMYCRQGEIYRQTHPDSPNNKLFANVYEWFLFTIMYDSHEQFKEAINPTPLFGDDAIDAKKFLEEMFGIKFL